MSGPSVSTEDGANTGHCHVCDEPIPTHDLLGHLRVMHPDVYGDGPITWPDGGYVIEEPLSIEDFTGGEP